MTHRHIWRIRERALSIACPQCWIAKGQACRFPNNKRLAFAHEMRVRAAMGG
jgi:hypothetical protein